ncbi:MAG TPA: lysophospholipid acyltransferase family protein [Terriglobia bacterium]|nr:lysophospholipid acyltransferase family protein [Terriglobia bacterium]
MTGFRAFFFNLCYFTWTVAIHVVCLPLLLGPRRWVLAAGRVWIRVSLWLLRIIVGLDHREKGLENLPHGPAIVAVKHQSAWETLYLSLALHHPAFVLKRELIWIPLFGWYLRKVGMIAIDRSAKSAALKSMVRQAERAFAQGRQIIIFPEGTRVAPGQHKPYQPGIAALYGQLKVPVVPVALNSGLFWGRKAFLKRPGTLTVEYLPPIPAGLDRKSFMKRLEGEIETAANALARLPDHP